jgi:predicted thioesterase
VQPVQPGIEAEITIATTSDMGITHLGKDVPSFYSTPSMIGLMEQTAIKAITPYLDPGEQTVGVQVNVSHIAATPIGMMVTARAKLLETKGRRLVFAVEAYNEKEKIGEGTHERAVIQIERFRKKG